MAWKSVSLSLDKHRFQISFDDPTAPLQFNFEWQGVHEPADSIGLHLPGGVAGLSNMHIEQMGRISGSMKYRDERFDLAGIGPRDHSVGTRQWESMIWYDLAWVLMDDGRAFGLIQTQQDKRSGSDSMVVGRRAACCRSRACNSTRHWTARTGRSV